ncbi:MAG: sulfotransferase, partial [Bacteroidota bacterium]
FFYHPVVKLLARDGGSRFLEKTPFHVLHLEYLARHFVNAKFINMIRDGRDGYVSNKRLTAGATLDQSVYEYSSLWKRSIVARRKLGNHSRILDVKYEDLTSNPSLWAKKIMDFLDEEFFEYQIRLGSSSGSKMFSGESGHERLSQPIAPTSVGQWRKSLTQEEIEGFHSTAGTMLEAMGYNLH